MMDERVNGGLKETFLKIRCSHAFKGRLKAAAELDSRSMSNLVVTIMTKYYEQQGSILSSTPPLYLYPKAGESNSFGGE